MYAYAALIFWLALVALVVYGHKQGCRRSNDAVLGGVCAGLAPKLDMPVAAVRLIAVLLLVFTGAALPAYIVAWIIWSKE